MTPGFRLRALELRVVHRDMPWLDRAALMDSGEQVRRAILTDLERLLAEALAGCDGDAALDRLDLAVTYEAGGAAARLRAVARPAPAAGLALPAPARPGRPAAATAGDGRAPGDAPPPAAGPSDSAAPPHAPTAAAAGSGALLAVLLAWQAEASLARRLALVPEAQLRDWRLQLLHLFGGAVPAGAPAAGTGPGPVPADRPADGHSPRPAPPALPGEAAALLALVALAARHAPRQPPADAIAALPAPAAAAVSAVASPGGRADAGHADPAVPAPPGPGGDPAADPAVARHPAATNPAAQSTPLAALARGLPATAAIDTALPFLMLGPLHRIGWLDAAGAALAAVGLAEAAAVLGFALALKGLPPPARGWRHDPALLQAAALAAGLAEPPPGESVAAFGRALGDRLALADAVLADALLRGRRAHAPLALVAATDWLALVEPEGLFPLALGRRWEAIATVAAAAAAPLVCGPRSAAPGHLGAIDRSGIAFAAAGAPARGEAWRRIAAGAGWHGMTNADPAAHPGLARAAAGWARDEAQAGDLLDAFGPHRPISRQAGSALDRSLTLAAMVALADIAWRLQAAEPALEPAGQPTAWASPDAGLAFDRFTGLAARVAIDAGRIEVLLPLGPRARDLRRAGLCADVSAAWFAGRRLRFAVG